MHAITLFAHAIMLFTHAIMLFAHAIVLSTHTFMLFRHVVMLLRHTIYGSDFAASCGSTKPVADCQTAHTVFLLMPQILGAEARSRVPAEYIQQQPTSANPPTLFLVLAQMANEIATASADDAASGRMHDQQLFLKAGESCASHIQTENAPAHMQFRALLR